MRKGSEIVNQVLINIDENGNEVGNDDKDKDKNIQGNNDKNVLNFVISEAV